VFLFGATVCSFRTADGVDRLFLSSCADLSGRSPIRGGVPVVFPQFADQGPLTKHGFARTAMWTLREAGDGRAVLQLCDSEATQASWPHAFRLTLTVQAGAQSLSMQLAVDNPGAEPFPFEALLHTYLLLAAAEGTEVHVPAANKIRDKVRGGIEVDAEGPSIALSGETDRV